jgi:hypothetical protein
MLLVVFKSFAPIRSAQNFCAMYGFHKSIKTKILSIQKSNSQLINGLAISYAEVVVGLNFNPQTQIHFNFFLLSLSLSQLHRSHSTHSTYSVYITQKRKEEKGKRTVLVVFVTCFLLFSL